MIRPFRFFANKVLPLVYDDSLSYYEVLAKLTGKVNEVIENVNNNLEEYIKENLPEIYADTLYDSVTKTIIFSDEPDPVDSGETVEKFQIGPKIISARDANAQTKITQLGTQLANTQDDLSNANGRITSIGNSVTQLQKEISYPNVVNLKGRNIVCFGDSWTTGAGASQSANKFTTKVAESLGMNEFNYGVGGSGFVMPNNIGQQISNASSNMTTTQKANTSIVLICAGVNDVRYLDQFTISEFTAAIDSAIASAHAAFPNALIVAVIGNTLCHGMSEVMLHWITTGQETAQLRKAFPVMVCRGCENWIRNQDIRFASDGLHPSDTGHLIWASFIVNAITGGSNYVQDMLQTMQFETGVSATVYPRVWKENGLIKVSSGRITFSENITETTLIGHINPTCAPEENIYSPVYTGNIINGTLAITGSGNVYVTPTNEMAACYFPGCDWLMY